MRKVCPRCGAAFNCQHDTIASCHCASVGLDTLQREFLKENYPDCLCHDCLMTVKNNFYTCKINPLFERKKDDQKDINCQ